MPAPGLTMREKIVVDALRLLDGPERNREQNFLYIINEYRTRITELEVQNGQLAGYLSTAEDQIQRLRDSL